MNISKNSVARKIMMVALMVVALIAVSFSVNASHVHVNAAARNQVSVQANNQPAKQVNNNQPAQKGAQFNKMLTVAKSKLGHKYSWGATGPNRFDCSGFTSYVYRKSIHKTLPRTAQAQYNVGKHISYNRRKAGDLVFFGGSRHSISHVGLYIGKGKMIDAQNRGVVVENVKAPWWHLVGIARLANLR